MATDQRRSMRMSSGNAHGKGTQLNHVSFFSFDEMRLSTHGPHDMIGLIPCACMASIHCKYNLYCSARCIRRLYAIVSYRIPRK